MNITKEMALVSLRPNLDSWSTLGQPTEMEITHERNRLDKLSDDSEKKRLRRTAHPVDIGVLADLVEDITNRVLVLEKRK